MAGIVFILEQKRVTLKGVYEIKRGDTMGCLNIYLGGGGSKNIG